MRGMAVHQRAAATLDEGAAVLAALEPGQPGILVAPDGAPELELETARSPDGPVTFVGLPGGMESGACGVAIHVPLAEGAVVVQVSLAMLVKITGILCQAHGQPEAPRQHAHGRASSQRGRPRR